MDKGGIDDHRSVAHSLSNLEKEIALLKSQNEAYIIRTSLMNSKLQDTLDTLDALSISAAHELIQEQRTSEILRRKLSQSISYAKGMEKERDELREAVEKFVQKVEQCDSFAAWPRGQLHLSKHLEPLPPDRLSDGRQYYQSKDLRQSSFVLTTLKEDLKIERLRADTAEREVVQLQAKVARREAELENCIIHTGHSLPQLKTNVPPLKVKQVGHFPEAMMREENIPASSLTKEDIERLSDIAISRNRSLELEVRAVNEKLEHVRSEQIVRTKNGTGRNTVRTGIRDRVPHATHGGRQPHKSPHLAQLKPDLSPPSYTNSHPHQAQVSSGPHTMPTSAKHEVPPVTDITILTVQHQMEDQIQRLSNAIDQLATERRLVRGFLDERAREMAEEMDDPTVVNRPDSPGDVRRGRSVSVRPITGHHLTLPDSQSSDQPGPTGQQNEERFLCVETKEGRSNIIDLLDDDERPPPTPFPLLPTPTEATGRTVVDHDDDGSTERSMELSTPLQSTVILGEIPWESMQDNITGDHVDPQATEILHEPLHDMAVDPSCAHRESGSFAGGPQNSSVEDIDAADRSHREYMERRIEQLEGELRAAREELSATDESLRQLREFVEIVQLEMIDGDHEPADDMVD
ncbi:hypothetical protein QCA50_013548 [Cerrena zonata]|uniref:Uncharacterized protein n=1 Tax=Cerrena zonata TaxID=2478898 RepID=A0AAW0FR80_9APHY